MEWGKGLFQQGEKKADADELSRIALQAFARTIDDKYLNNELKERQRRNNPAAAFLTKSSKSSTSSRPKYSGPPPPPNQYGINPGYRWDGGDWSNGFEAKLFQTGNDQKQVLLEQKLIAILLTKCSKQNHTSDDIGLYSKLMYFYNFL
ncbi:hypothetical protein O181_001189 [Austropuccinia psidii MF-1]|uniref:Uncharacterized protein n=1 Tax=Austropuccinia psidii MF-1 TaxID=1389203 RepID=A0A9Q3BA13_9BASI|nr:hypothetical protein [Austropuccinia psidii MF-1]